MLNYFRGTYSVILYALAISLESCHLKNQLMFSIAMRRIHSRRNYNNMTIINNTIYCISKIFCVSCVMDRIRFWNGCVVEIYLRSINVPIIFKYPFRELVVVS